MKKNNFKKGFTLIELLVVVAIIGILAAVILVSLGNARGKGSDAAVKSNLLAARSQAEVFWNTNTAVRESYQNVCAVGPVGGAKTINENVLAAAKAAGLTSVGVDNVPAASTSVATCNDTDGAWAAEVPLKTAGQMWCVDSIGKSKQTSSSIGATTVCP